MIHGTVGDRVRLALVFSALVAGGCGGDDSAPAAVVVFGRHGTGAGEFIEPRAAAASPDGRIFVIDRTGRVQRFRADGTLEHSWEMPDSTAGRGRPSGVCADGSHRVLVADTHFHRVVVFAQDGNELSRFGERGFGPGQFMLPTDVAVDTTGNIYVSEYGGNDRVSKFDSRGNFVLSFGGIDDGSAALQRPSGLAIDDEDCVWVADAGNHRLCRFDRSGRLLSTVGGLGGGPGQFRYPRDVVALPSGRLVVADYGNNRVVCFAVDGSFLGSWGRPGRGAGDLNNPVNITACRGDLYIADSRNHRLVKAQLDFSFFKDTVVANAAAHRVSLESSQ